MEVSEAARSDSAPDGRAATAPLAWRRSFVLLVADGTLFYLALALVDTTSVLPALLRRLTSEPVLIGLLGSIFTGGWLLPQLVAARFAATRRRKLPWLIAFTTAGRASWLVLFVALALYDRLPSPVVIAACYLSVIGFWFCDGVSALLWYEVIGRAIPSTVRGRLFGAMSLCGGLMAIAASAILGTVVGNPQIPFPRDYQAAVGIAMAIFLVGVLPLVMVQEPPSPPPSPPAPFWTFLRRLPVLLRERGDFRRIVTVQLLVGWAGLAVPFYAPYGLGVIGLPESRIGQLVLATAGGATLGGMAWGLLGDRGRHELAVRLVAVIAVVAPLSAIAIGRLSAGVDLGAFVIIYAFPFLLIGAGVRSAWVAFMNYLMEIAGRDELAVLVGLTNTLAGTLALAPIVGGLIVSWLGYEVVFAAAMVPTLAGTIVSLRLRPTRGISTSRNALRVD